LAAALFAAPALAITVANGNVSSAQVNPADPVFLGADQTIPVDLSGVVEISTAGIGGCTGSLLSNGTSILTAAHCVDGASASGITILFQGPTGFVSYTAASFTVDPAYDGTGTDGSDLAVIQLSALAPAFATEYQLDMEPAVYGVADVLAGYGYGGTGAAGAEPANYPFGTLSAGENDYAENAAAFGDTLNPQEAFSSGDLVGQFYESGHPSTNVLSCGFPSSPCQSNPFTAVDEVDISEGDSGGPTFQDVDGTMEIVGVHDFIGCVTTNCTPNSAFGDVFGDTSVSANLSFIDSQIAPEPRTLSMMLAALLSVLFLRLRRSESVDGEVSSRQRRALRRHARG
jgi:hypothetical protein